MTEIERLERINQIELEIARSVTQSRYFRSRSCRYDAPTRAMPARIKKLLEELDRLEREKGNTTPTQYRNDNVVGYAEL